MNSTLRVPTTPAELATEARRLRAQATDPARQQMLDHLIGGPAQHCREDRDEVSALYHVMNRIVEGQYTSFHDYSAHLRTRWLHPFGHATRVPTPRRALNLHPPSSREAFNQRARRGWLRTGGDVEVAEAD